MYTQYATTRRGRFLFRCVFYFLATLALPGIAAADDKASFTPLGALPGAWFTSTARGVSADGQVITGDTLGSGTSQTQAFRWTSATGMVSVGAVPNGYTSSAIGMSGDASAIIGSARVSNSSIEHAFRWTASTGMVDLGQITGYELTAAIAVSRDGETVVGLVEHAYPLMRQAFRWTPSTGLVALGVLPGATSTVSEARAVSADGSVVVGASRSGRASGYEAFRWSAQTGMVGLGLLPGGISSNASSVSLDGQVVAGNGTTTSTGGNLQAFRWTAATGTTGLGVLPGTSSSTLLALSADGNTAVGWSGTEAFRWTPQTGMIGLGHLPGDSTTSAEFVSADGSIVAGHAGFADGRNEIFIWTATTGLRSLRAILAADGVDVSAWRNLKLTRMSEDGRTLVGDGYNPLNNPEAWMVKLPNKLPVVNAGNAQGVNEGVSVTLSGSASDTDGTVVSYQWTQTGGPAVALISANTAIASFTAPLVTTDTTLVFQLAATDNNGGVGSASVNVVVRNVNQLPTANAGANQAVFEGAAVTLSGSGFDPDGSIVSYQWTQTSGPGVALSDANSATASFVAPAVNADTPLTFQLVVIDNDGASASASTAVTDRNIPEGVDLVVTSVTSSVSTIKRGRQFDVTYTLHNQGNVNMTTSVYTGLYLSADGSITTGDTSLGSKVTYSLAAGTSVTVTRKVSVPSSLAPGVYYLGAIADVTGLQSELNESNNALTGSTIQVTK